MIWLREGLRLLRRSLSRSLLLALCWMLTLLLAGVLGWTLEHSIQFRQALIRRVPAECYLENADAATISAVRQTLAGCRSLEWSGLLSREQAAEEFRTGFGVDVVALLEENPFPTTVLLSVRQDAEPADLDHDLHLLSRTPGVSGTHIDRQMLGELGEQMRRLGYVLLGAGLLLTALTGALLAAAVRSLLRAYAGESRLLVLQGARPWQLTVPPAVALLVPALSAASGALLSTRALTSALAGMGLPAGNPPLWPFAAGLGLPLALGLGYIAWRARWLVQDSA